MKFCYVDESSAPHSPPLHVMVGIIADGQRIDRTRQEFSKALYRVNELYPEGLRELKGTKILYGRDGWRKVAPEDRKAVIRGFCEWVVERKHRLALSAICTDKFHDLPDGYPVVLRDVWLSGAIQIALQVQSEHQSLPKPKGQTVLIFDENKIKGDKLNEILFTPPAWTDEFYSRESKKERLDQIVDSAFFTKSHHAGLAQVADIFAFVLRRYSEIRELGMKQEYEGEYEDVASFVEIIRTRLLARSMRWSTRPKNECGSTFLNMAPSSLAELRGENG